VSAPVKATVDSECGQPIRICAKGIDINGLIAQIVEFTVIEVTSPYAANDGRRSLGKDLVIQPGEIVTLSNSSLRP